MAVTRRSIGLAALGGALLSAVPALAKTPAAGAQAAGVYRVKVGALEVTVLNDGSAALPTKFFSGDPTGVAKLMEAAFTPGDMAPTTFNEWLINTGDKLVLVDTGYSNGAGAMAGKLPKSLAAAGVDPAAIDAVVITHIHPDHCNGLLTTDKQIAFPNATVHVNADEFAWWMEGDFKVPEGKPFFKALFEGGRAAFKPYVDAKRVQLFKDGAELAPGSYGGHRARAHGRSHHDPHIFGQRTNAGVDGHRPQHGAAISRTGAVDRLRPRSAAGDRHPQEVMDMVATDRLLIAGTHIGFPGVGHVAKAASGYAFVPVPWNANL
jgi:hypothetical protein